MFLAQILQRITFPNEDCVGTSKYYMCDCFKLPIQLEAIYVLLLYYDYLHVFELLLDFGATLELPKRPNRTIITNEHYACYDSCSLD
jgi:hypothetical protein